MQINGVCDSSARFFPIGNFSNVNKPSRGEKYEELDQRARRGGILKDFVCTQNHKRKPKL